MPNDFGENSLIVGKSDKIDINKIDEDHAKVFADMLEAQVAAVFLGSFSF